MEESAQQSASRGSTAKRLADAVLSTVRNRVELFALEFQEERLWLFSTFIWIAVSLFFGFASLIIIALTAAEFASDELRPFVLLGFAVLYVAVTLIALLTLRKKMKEKRPPFAGTLSELNKDISCLRSQD